MLILFCGIPASGKTIIAAEVSKKLKRKVIHIQSDTIRHMITTPIYDDFESELVYNSMNALTKTALMSNYVVILDGTFLRQEWREKALFIAKNLGKRTALIQVICSVDEAIRRNRRRKSGVPEEIIVKFDEIFEEPLDALKIDLETVSVQRAVEIVLSRIEL